ncbi:MAG: hypothetical protein AAF656_07935 [Planctomycetota bacterium]
MHYEKRLKTRRHQPTWMMTFWAIGMLPTIMVHTLHAFAWATDDWFARTAFMLRMFHATLAVWFLWFLLGVVVSAAMLVTFVAGRHGVRDRVARPFAFVLAGYATTVFLTWLDPFGAFEFFID